MSSKPYEILSDERSVTVYSSDYVPNEPKGWRKDLKLDIQKVLEQLHAADGEGVFAVYGCVDKAKSKSDTENVLFYNLRFTPFKQIASQGISFDTLSPQETTARLAQAGKSEYQHYYSYRISGTSSFHRHDIEPLLSWGKIALPSLSGEVLDYWKLMREHIGEVEVFEDKDYCGCFGIDIHICESGTKTENLVARMKKLLDGLICAFHRMPDDVNVEMLAAVASRFGLPIEQFLYNEKTILGARVYRRRHDWNPKDDCCTTANITIEYGADERCFSGKIYRRD